MVLLLLTGSASGRTVVDAGPAALRVDMSETEGCTVGLNSEVCAAKVETNGTTAPGDDEVFVVKSANRVQALVRLPVGVSDESVTVEPNKLVVDHPLFKNLNRTWLRTNDSLPDSARAFVTLDSRPVRYAPDIWGIFVTVHLPVEVRTPLMRDPINWLAAGVCWDLFCGNIRLGPYLASDDRAIRPASENVVTGTRDSDSLVEGSLTGPRGLFECYAWMTKEVCSQLVGLRGTFVPIVNVAKEATPQVITGFEFKRAVISVDGSAHGASAASAGLSAESSFDFDQHELRAPSAVQEMATPLRATSVETAADRLANHDQFVSGGPVSVRNPLAPGEGFGTGLVWLAGGLFLLLAFALYHRITRARALEQETRRRVYGLVKQEPGIRVGTIASRFGMDHKSVRHHASLLETLGLVKSFGVGHKRYFAADAVPSREAWVLLGSSTAKAIYEFLSKHGSADIPTIASSIGVAGCTVSAHAARLCGAGLLERSRAGRRVVLRARRDSSQRIDLTL